MVQQHTHTSENIDLRSAHSSDFAAFTQTLSLEITQQLFELTGEKVRFTSIEDKAIEIYARRYTFRCSCDELKTLARFIVFSAAKESEPGKSVKDAIIRAIADETDQDREWRKYLLSSTRQQELSTIDHAIWDNIQERVFAEIRAMSTERKPCRVLEVGGASLTGYKRISANIDPQYFEYLVVDLLDEDSFRRQHGDVPVRYLSKSINHVSHEDVTTPIDLIIGVRSFEYLPSPNVTLARLSHMGSNTLQCILVHNSGHSFESFHLKNKLFHYESLGAQYYLLGEILKGEMETSDATDALYDLIFSNETSERVVRKQLTHWNKMLGLLRKHAKSAEDEQDFAARLRRRHSEVARIRQQLHRMYLNRFSNTLSDCQSDDEIFRYYMAAGFNPTYNVELKIGKSARQSYFVHQLDKIDPQAPAEFYRNFVPYFSSTIYDPGTHCNT